jgi:hypothetical protein
MACVDSAYLNPLKHEYHEDAVFQGACGICGMGFEWHVKEAEVIEAPKLPTSEPE